MTFLNLAVFSKLSSLMEGRSEPCGTVLALLTQRRAMYEIFEHTADLGLRIRAATREELFVDAARGLFSMIVENLDDVQPRENRRYNIVGQDHVYLLFDWLNELLY